MAPSKESGALRDLFLEIGAAFPKDGNPYLSRVIYDQVHTAASEVPGVSYESTVAGGRPALWLRPKGASTQHVILFMHGGGYSFGSPNGHRKLAAHLAKACNCLALSVDYRLTPEVAFPVPVDDCIAAYKWLLDQGFQGKNVVTAGDSCGGSLSVTVPLGARQKGYPKNGAIVSLSPSYDHTCASDSMQENEENDVLNSKPFIDMLGDRYVAGGHSREDPMVSPIFADLKDLPPMWISCAGYDMLRDDGTRMAQKAQDQGVDVVCEVHEGQQHVFEFMAGKAPEADESLRKIGEWVRKTIGC